MPTSHPSGSSSNVSASVSASASASASTGTSPNANLVLGHVDVMNNGSSNGRMPPPPELKIPQDNVRE